MADGARIAVVADQLLAKIDRAVTQMGPRLSHGLAQSGLIVERAAKGKVSGEVLRVRTGRLRSSIQTSSPEEVGAGRYQVTVGTPVVYARIHELGGTIPAHTVRPVNAQALHFFVGGREVFARSASIPAVRMPARPFMAPSLREHESEIRAVIAKATTPLLGS